MSIKTIELVNKEELTNYATEVYVEEKLNDSATQDADLKAMLKEVFPTSTR